MATNGNGAERARRHRERMAEAGFVQVNVWVPAGSVAEIVAAAELMRADPTLRVARLMNTGTGRMVGIKKGLQNAAARPWTERKAGTPSNDQTVLGIAL